MEKGLPILFVGGSRNSNIAKKDLERAGIDTKIIEFEGSDEGSPPILLDGGARYDGLRLIRMYINQQIKSRGYYSQKIWNNQ